MVIPVTICSSVGVEKFRRNEVVGWDSSTKNALPGTTAILYSETAFLQNSGISQSSGSVHQINRPPSGFFHATFFEKQASIVPCIAFASRIIPDLRHNDILPVGWKYRAAHESPNSAWSEAAFAAALGLKLGGPAVYGDLCVDHPWLGDGTPDAKPAHIVLAVRLMWHSVIVFTLFEVFLIGILSL